jgi:Ca-activated chloride channel family protein
MSQSLFHRRLFIGNFSLRAQIFALLFALWATLALAEPTAAQGVVIPREPGPERPLPRPMPRPGPRPLPPTLKVKSVSVTVSIQNQVAQTHVEQVFINDTPYTLEGVYCFPIPESAALTEFAIWDGDRRLVGEVVERGQARRVYNEIVRTLRDPGLLEYVGKDLFQANVFPIPGRSEKKIELTYSQVLNASNGVVGYRYPLASGRRAMNAPPQSAVASVSIDSPVALKAIYSPSHAIDTKRIGETKARLTLEATGAKAAEDFQLYFGLGEKDFGVSLLTHRDPGKDGYFLLLVAPKSNISERERLPKDVVFIFDTSGSMSGEKMEKAQNALRFGLRSLSPQDRFNVIRFSGEERMFDAGLPQATPDNIARAVRFVDEFRAEGGTNIQDALLAGLRLFAGSSERPRMAVFLTDGLPTVGVTDVKAIEAAVAKANQVQARVFTFGVGYDVNTRLLDAIASQNRAVSDYIEPQEDLEVKVSSFFARVNHPILSDLKLDFGDVDIDAAYPRTPPDLFQGGQIVLVGRYRGSERRATVRLSGVALGRQRTFAYENQMFPQTESANAFLPKLWATRRVGALLEQIRLNGENAELVEEIVTLGTRHGIVTPYTSYLALEGDVARRFSAAEERAAAPGGIRTPRPSKEKKATPPTRSGAVSGEAAVADSKQAARLRDAEKAERLETDTVKTVLGKTFFLRDGVWTDSEFDETRGLPVIETTFGEDEYFALIGKTPKLSDYFAIGVQVVVVVDGTVYRVREAKRR